MQYYKPEAPYNAGDCMPFYDDGTFHLYYLLDEDHHHALGGLGGHQWAHASSTDLVHWDHHPLAIGITEADEGSICTGSIFHHGDIYYGFYATRTRTWTQHMSVTTSTDGIAFEKRNPSLFFPPEDYDPLHFRDPVVFQDEEQGLFHALVTARLRNAPVPDRGGCLAHLVSVDLAHWDLQDPFLIPGFIDVPECPDYFRWRGWYYLLFSSRGVAHYRMSRQPFGPWLRPDVDTLDGPASRVMKTAAYHDDRRIGVAWLGARAEDRDNGEFLFGGHVIFRELVQHADGTLGASFVPEMLPGGDAIAFHGDAVHSYGARVEGQQVHIPGGPGLRAATLQAFPRNTRITLRIHPQAGAQEFGLRLRANDTFDSGYALNFAPQDRLVRLNAQVIYSVTGLDTPFTLEVVLYDDLIDVCIGERRTLIDRCPEKTGSQIFVYAKDCGVSFEVVEMVAIR